MPISFNDALYYQSGSGSAGWGMTIPYTITEGTTRMVIMAATGANSGANVNSITWSEDSQNWTQVDNYGAGDIRQFIGYIDRPDLGAGSLAFVASAYCHKIVAVVGLGGDLEGAEGDYNQGTGDRTLTTISGGMCFSSFVGGSDPGATPDVGSTFLFQAYQGGSGYDNIWLEAIYKAAVGQETILGWTAEFYQIGISYDPVASSFTPRIGMVFSKVQDFYNDLREGIIPRNLLEKRHDEVKMYI
jgi:hypothetical protein